MVLLSDFLLPVMSLCCWNSLPLPLPTYHHLDPTFFAFFLKILFYLFDRETASERGNTSRGSGRGRSRLPAEKPDVGLDPITPGSRPEPKAEA